MNYSLNPAAKPVDDSYPVAVIDVGSNSIKLLVAQAEGPQNTPKALLSEMVETRIGSGMSLRNPKLHTDAIRAGTKTIVQLLQKAKDHAPTETLIVATGAVREAMNRNAFIQSVSEATGLCMRILSEGEEAIYVGRGLLCDPAISGMNRFIQSDLGGGSLELVAFKEGQIVDARSLPLGAIRLSERFIESPEAPLSEATETAIRQHVREVLYQDRFSCSPDAGPLVATGGTCTVVRSVLAAGQPHTFSKLERSDLNRFKQRIASLPLKERGTLPYLPVARADILPTALITMDTLLEFSKRSCLTHSFYNLRYGIAAELLKTTDGNHSLLFQ